MRDYYRPRTKYDGRLYFQFICLLTKGEGVTPTLWFHVPSWGEWVTRVSGPMPILREGDRYPGKDRGTPSPPPGHWEIGTLSTPRAVRLLRLRRRTFLFITIVTIQCVVTARICSMTGR